MTNQPIKINGPSICGKTGVNVPVLDPYPENENSQKSITSSASLHIYNVQTKGIQHRSKSMVKPAEG